MTHSWPDLLGEILVNPQTGGLCGFQDELSVAFTTLANVNSRCFCPYLITSFSEIPDDDKDHLCVNDEII